MDDQRSAQAALRSTENSVDLEKGDHAVQSQDVSEKGVRAEEPAGSIDPGMPRTNTKVEDVSEAGLDEFEDPFALFPALSVSMSSTQAPFMRRNTTATLGRPLTREETLQTIKTIRSRFTEARSEFDEHVCHDLLFSFNIQDDIPELAAIDENLVTFDGPKDPMNPKNWPPRKKWATTLIMAMYAFLAPFASSILVLDAPMFGLTVVGTRGRSDQCRVP